MQYSKRKTTKYKIDKDNKLDTKHRILKFQHIRSRKNKIKFLSRHIIMKLQNVKDNEVILKNNQWEKKDHLK